jgi:cell division protease FtsH
MRNVIRNFLYFFLAFVLVAGILSTLSTSGTTKKTVGLEELVAQINAGTVMEVLVSGDRLDITLADGSREISRKEPTESLSQLLKNYSIAPDKMQAVKVSVKDNSGTLFWLNTILPFLIPFLLIAGFIWITFRQVQGQNSKALSFGQSAARETTPREAKQKVTFADVAGVKEAKTELLEIVEFLKNPRKFTSLGARIPKGVLLVGAPGTGKTLLAKAVAGEANVPFFNISGSEFVEMFVGVGASRVRDLFKKAKRHAPCIVFIDEIDAVGRQRGAGLGGSHDEREQTLNQILVEMDGFDTDTNVIVVAATNRPDILDPALLRPGRFDRRVVLDEPDINDREAILKVHAGKKPLAPSVNMRTIAERTPGFTGADLANLLNEAAILAARQNRKSVEMSDCLESIEKVLLGPERKSHILSDREKKITAYHEAGHALVAHVLPAADPVHKVSIISRGRAAGYTLKLPTEDKHLHARSEFIADLAVMLAGWTTEKETFREVTTGASNDLRQATKLARQLVTVYGMSDLLGPRTFGEKDELIFLGREITEQRDYSDKVAESIDSEVTKFITVAQRTAKAIVTKFKPQLERIVKALIEKETLEREEFEALLTDVPKGTRFATQAVRA